MEYILVVKISVTRYVAFFQLYVSVMSTFIYSILCIVMIISLVYALRSGIPTSKELFACFKLIPIWLKINGASSDILKNIIIL